METSTWRYVTRPDNMADHGARWPKGATTPGLWGPLLPSPVLTH
jgi:hypothetical protein